jgi:hypothetical protein
MAFKENSPLSSEVDADKIGSAASHDKNNKVMAIPEENLKGKQSSLAKNNDDETSTNSSPEAAMASSFHYFVFCILFMNGFMAHCRKYNDKNLMITLLHLVCFVLVESPSNKRRYSNCVFLSFLLFCIYSTIEGLPGNANHHNFTGYASLLLLPQQVRRVLTGPDVSETNAALNVLRYAIVTLYFMAGFHKINTDFLFRSEYSCAYDMLWLYLHDFLGLEESDLEEHRLHRSWLKFLPFMGLFVEMVPPILLLFGATQKWGILLLIQLHLLLLPLGFSDFGSIAQSLLWLFVAPQAAVKALPIHFFKDMAIFFAAFQLIVLVVWECGEEDDAPFQDAEAAMVFITYGIMWASVFRIPTSFPGARFTIPKSIFSFIALVSFFLFALSPYFGLRTTGTLTMFSNLRTEGPRSNHVLLRSNPLKLFNYQDDLVEVMELDPRVKDLETEVLYPKLFFSRVVQDQDDDGLYLTIRHQGNIYKTEDLTSDPVFDIFRTEESWWHYKLFHFRAVSIEGPQECLW